MKLVEELDFKFNFEQLKKETPNMFDKDNPLFLRFWGMSVQHRKNIPSPWDFVDGLEGLNLYKNCTEQSFNIIHENFKNTEFERIITNFNLYRSRLLLVKEKHSYSIHQDKTWRLHIPIKTNPGCIFYFPDHQKHFHLEEGKIYKVNTTVRHTFVNTSNNTRIHFMGCIY